MHVRHLTHEHFDSDMYDLYFSFLCERQRIWVRRAHLGMDRPWTTDRTLNYEFITNVYRELDPGTEYVIDTICGDENTSHINKVFNIMVYRLMGSQISTNVSLGFMEHDNFSTKRYMRSVGTLPGNPFGDAYRVAGYGDGVGSKIANVGDLIAELAHSMPEWHRRMCASANARDLFNVFTSIKGFGTFLSNQCMVDCLMIDEMGLSDSAERVWSFGTDEWCEPGPGAKRGLTKILASGVKPANLHMVMAWLRDAQEAEWDRLGLNFPFLLNANDSIKRLTICNIQTTLCEFSKYVRSRGHVNVRAYHSVPSKLEPFDISLSVDEIEELRDITACTPGESMYVAPTEADEELDTEVVGAALEPAVAHEIVRVSLDDAPPIVAAPTAPGIDQSLLSILASTLGAKTDQQKPLVIPVDPTGLLGLPKAIMIVPIY